MSASLLIDEIVSFPEVGKAGLVAELLGDALPKHPATFHAVITNGESNSRRNNFTTLSSDTGPADQSVHLRSDPEPPLVAFFNKNDRC